MWMGPLPLAHAQDRHPVSHAAISHSESDLLALGFCLSLLRFSFVMPKERSCRPGRPPRSARSCAASRAILSGNATPSEVHVSADEVSSPTDLNCSWEELLVLI